MAPVTTPNVLLLKGPFNDSSRKYPIWKYLEDLVDWFDLREHDDAGIQEFYTDDFSFLTPHADRMESSDGHGEDHAFNRGAAKIYTEPLSDHKHALTTCIALEAPGAWDVYAQMAIFANIAGEPADGEEKVKDDDGKEWEVEIPTFYHLKMVQVPNAPHSGLKMQHVTMIKDTGLVNDKLDARGVGHKRSIN